MTDRIDNRIENLIQQMTVEEKVSMLAGADTWHTVAIERLGIPAIKMTDGPFGARGARGRGGPTSASFPVGVALAATWNPALVGQVGQALAAEVKAKGAHILLGPTVNIHRSPLAGRNFECYSEDPYLTARMAVAYIHGLQGQGVGACIKHFVCNDSEFERRSLSSDVGERALHEIYFTPFRTAMREAQPWAVMSAYNKVNGTWCSENPYLLRQVLKGEWGFDGVVISDWVGTYTPAAASNGLDLEMPGPARWMGQHVVSALESGALSHQELDDAVRRILRTVERAGAFEQPELQPERAVDRPEDRALIRQVAGEAIVLLKNQGNLLPLPGSARSIAVIGEMAEIPSFQGGGSSHVRPHYVISPLEGIRARAGSDVAVNYAPGYSIRRTLPLLNAAWLTAEDGTPGALTARFYDGLVPSGTAVHTETLAGSEVVWFGDEVPVPHPTRFAVRLSGTLTVPETGRYELGLTTSAPSQLWIAGRPLTGEATAAGHGAGDRRGLVSLTGGQPVELVLEYLWDEPIEPWRWLRLAGRPAVGMPTIEEAVALAGRSDVAIVVAGLSDEWESEDFDRPDMSLPGPQAKLIAAVAAANPNTVVVLHAGSPVSMPWLDDVPAVVLAWYLGQETGHAIADVLWGDVVPSGRLPTTFPRRLQDNPAYLNYPGENGHVLYGEGIFSGYRYYDKKEIEPLFPFGHGLSYTTFAYTRLALDAAEYGLGDPIRVSVDVENTGALRAQEVVQLYVRDLESTLARPDKELKAFAKVEIEPGQTRSVELVLGDDALAFYDPARDRWIVEPGEFEILVGHSATDIRLSGRLRVTGEEP